MDVKALFRRPIRYYLERSVAHVLLRNPNVRVVAITGSVGKTSTKFAVASVLREGGRVLANHSNYNSEFGLPLAIFELNAPVRITDVKAWLGILLTVRKRVYSEFPYDTLVLELGTDHSGDLRQFMHYLKPDVAVVTAITPEHMEHFKTIEAVGDEEFTVARASDSVVAHSNDREIMDRIRTLQDVSIITYGTSGEVHWAGGDALCLGSDRDAIIVRPQVLGEHLRLSLLAAAAIGVTLGLGNEEILRGINNVEPVPGRMQRLEGINDSILIDDTYNSSPEAALAALGTLSSMTVSGRRIALLGQMNELGDYSPEAHVQVGEAAATTVDLLLTLTGDANTILGPAAVAVGLEPERLYAFESPYAAGLWLREHVRVGDVILCKGSQNKVFAEEAVKQLLAHPEDAAKLVRQSDAWLTTKRAQFSDALA